MNTTYKPSNSDVGQSKRWMAIAGVTVILGSAAIAFFCWHQSPPQLFPEFMMFPSVRSFDPPGTIFRVNSDGVRYDVVDLSGNVKIFGGSETIPNQSGRRTVATKAIFSALNMGDVTAARSVAYDVTLIVEDATREKTTDLDIDKAIAVALQAIALRKDSRYFIIRETISARGLSFVLNSRDASKLAAEIKHKVAEGKTSTDVSDKSATTLVKKFDHAMRVFYKPEEILVNESGATGELKVSRLRIDTLVWHEAPR